MAGRLFCCCLLSAVSVGSLALDMGELQVPLAGVAGVLLVQGQSKGYSFNATTASSACDALNMRIAKKAEVEVANADGFQTCRFGWVEEQIAVISRAQPSPACGQNKTGVVVWRADVSRMFDVYCFKPADTDAPSDTRPARPSTEAGRTSASHSSSSTSRSLPPHTSTLPVTSPFFPGSTRGSQSTSVRPPQWSSSSSSALFSPLNSLTVGPPLSQTTSSSSKGPKAVAVISALLFLLAAAAGTAWFLRRKRSQQLPSLKRLRESEMWNDCLPEPARKDNNNRKCINTVVEMEQKS